MSRPWPLRVIYCGDDRPIPAALGAIDELAAGLVRGAQIWRATAPPSHRSASAAALKEGFVVLAASSCQ